MFSCLLLPYDALSRRRQSLSLSHDTDNRFLHCFVGDYSMAGGGCQGGISGLKVCDFEVPPRQRCLCSVSALATTKTQKYRHAKYACLILAPLYSLHTAPSASAGILKTNFQGQKIPGRKVECTLLPSKAVVRNFRTTHNSVTTTKFQTLSGILWYTVLTITY